MTGTERSIQSEERIQMKRTDWRECLKTSINGTVQISNLFIAPLPTAVCRDKRLLTDLCAPFVSKKPTAVRDGAVTLKRSHSMEDIRIFLKIFAPHSLMTNYRMNLISTGSISLGSIPVNSTFNETEKKKQLSPILSSFSVREIREELSGKQM